MNKCLIILALISLVFSFDPASKISSYSDDLAKFYLHFASAGYCKDDQIASGTCCTSFFSKYGFKTIAHGIENDYNYNYGIFKSTKLKKIVVAVPGTRSEYLEEVMNSGLTKYGSYKIVKYFKTKADNIRSGVKAGLKEALKNTSGYQVIFTGHSLGGAVSSILALYMYEDGVISTRNSITLVTYGQPKTGNKKFVDKIMSIAKVFRIVRDNDLVVSLAAVDVPIINDTEHLGGKIRLNHKMTQYYVCPYSQRSFFIGTCTNLKLPKLKSHSYLANDAELSKYCRK